MVNTCVAYTTLLHKVMKLLGGVRPQTVEIDPRTVMNFWVPNEKQQPDKKKPNVVLLHGFAADGIITWQFQVPFLTSKYSVYVPDFLFFGSSTTDSERRSPEFQAECLAKGLKKLGVDKCIIVGFSYGGMVGFKLAEMYPDLVESMIISCSVLALTQSITRDCLERMNFSCWSDYMLPNSVEGVKILFSVGMHKLPWIPNRFLQDYLKVMFSNRKERAELLEALVTDDKDFTIPNYTQKIHLLCGANDKIFPKEIAHNLKEQLGDTTTLQFINNAGHLVQLERPCVYTKCLKKLLASLESE